VTFLFTDIEGSTRRWETEPEAMRAALVLHDEVLRSAIDAHGGWLFKHTGDGVCAAFGSARAAIDVAVEAQQTLGLPVRMGVATGEAERRGDDYFGPVLNRTARVMAAGHGGQILVAASTAAVVSGVDLVDRGEHRLRDLSGAEHLYQVRASPSSTRGLSRHRAAVRASPDLADAAWLTAVDNDARVARHPRHRPRHRRSPRWPTTPPCSTPSP